MLKGNRVSVINLRTGEIIDKANGVIGGLSICDGVVKLMMNGQEGRKINLINSNTGKQLVPGDFMRIDNEVHSSSGSSGIYNYFWVQGTDGRYNIAINKVCYNGWELLFKNGENNDIMSILTYYNLTLLVKKTVNNKSFGVLLDNDLQVRLDGRLVSYLGRRDVTYNGCKRSANIFIDEDGITHYFDWIEGVEIKPDSDGE